MPPTLEQVVEAHRASLEKGVVALQNLRKDIADFPVGENEDRAEVIANIMLSLRHVEDAKMRLGKVFQAINGGVSNNSR